jgi:AraC-like DNA-binding protein
MSATHDSLPRQIELAFIRRLLAQLASRSDVDGPGLISAAGIPYERFVLRPEDYPGIGLLDLLQALQGEPRCGGIALSFGFSRQITDLGVLGYTILSCRDLRQVTEVLQRYNALTADSYQVQFLELEGEVINRIWIRREYRDQRVLIDEENLSGLCAALFSLLPQQADRGQISVRLGYPPPAHEPLYRELFPGPVQFDCADTELRFPAAWLSLPVQTADETVERTCEAQCRRLLAQVGESVEIADRARRVMLSVPPGERLKLAQVAEKLFLSSRSLERQLQAAGTSFREIDYELRMLQAAEYLELGYLSSTEISYMLGYSQPATFNRAFKKWFGLTPGGFQRRQQDRG